MTEAPLPYSLVETVVEESPEAILITQAPAPGTGPVICYANRAFERLTGWSAADVIGKTPAILQGPDTDDSVLADARDAILKKRNFVGQTINYTRGGEAFVNRWRMRPVEDKDGREFWIAYLSNATPVVEREEKLQAVEQRFSDLAANIPGAIFRYLIHPDGRDEIEYMSPGCLHIWEVDADTLRGDPSMLWAMIDEEDLPAMQASVMASAEHLTRWNHRWRITTPSGQFKWLQGQGRASRLADGTTLFNSLILDITDQVATQDALDDSQAQLYQAQKLEAVGQLTGGIAHDFNNLLAVLLGNLELLAENPDADGRQDFLDDSIRAARRGRELTRSLLNFARRAQLNPEPLRLNDVLTESERLFQRVLPEAIELRVSGEPDLSLVSLDRATLDSALLNLVINARDAMKGQGQLSLETTNLTIGPDVLDASPDPIRPGRYVMVAVSDTGSGIAPEHLPQVTDPFFTTKPTGAGTGLGLSMVQGFAKQSGGFMRIYSEPGQGTTTVKLFFPVRDGLPSTPAPDARRTTTMASRDAHILLVEDQDDVRRVMATRLARAGFTVTLAENGVKALEQVKQEPAIDLVLTDLVMPGEIQGDGLVQEIRRLEPQAPVIVMSGYPGDAAAGADQLPDDIPRLMKPVDGDELIAAINQVLSPRSGTDS